MTMEIPYYGLRAYALFFLRHGSKEEFGQSELDWIVSEPMKKKIFSLLVRAGWLNKTSRNRYMCTEPAEAISHLLDFRVPKMMDEAEKPYAFTGLSAIEIWSDYCYVQRGMGKSPYFIKVLREDLNYWKEFFNSRKIPNYVGKGATIGEYVILIPVEELEVSSLKVDSLEETMKNAKANSMHAYAYTYMKEKYGEKDG